jgi:hypothetical protein
MTVLLKNNAFGFLASAISASDTSISLTAGTGANFPTLGSGDYFYATLAPTSGNTEIVRVTARVGDVLTVVRAQEGTAAISFASGSRVELRVTAQSVIDAINDRVATKDQASEISIDDAGGYYTGTNVEAALQEAAVASTTQYDLGLANSQIRSVESRLQDSVSVFDYIPKAEHAAIKARTSTYDASADIQKAIDEASSVFFPDGTYLIDTPLTIESGDTLIGANSNRVIIKKSSATTGTGSNLARSGAVTDSYAVNALLIFKHADNSYTYGAVIKGIGLHSVGHVITYAIHATRTSQCHFEDVSTFQCRYGFYTFDSWLTTLVKCVFNANTIRFGGNSYGWPNATPSYGVQWADDGTGAATGTSAAFIDCWARDCHFGWYLYGLQYSTMNSCASDNISFNAYRFHLCRMTINGSACENVQIAAKAAFDIEGGFYVFNSCQAQALTGFSAGVTAALFISGGNVTFNNCQFDNFVSAGTSFNLVVQAGALVTNNGSSFPTNGNAFISYGSNSQWIDLNRTNPFIVSEATSSARRFWRGRVRGNQVQERIAKTIDAGGTVIATFTAGSSLNFGVCEFTVSWFDISFPTGAGVSKFLVAVHKDAASYREAISTATSAYANNGGAGAPTYTLSRVGDVWSLTMTPQDGACTAHTITAEMQSITDITLALP